MPKIKNIVIYPPDTNLSRDDSWVGSDAENSKNTKTYYLGVVADFIADEIGADISPGTNEYRIVSGGVF